jgi:hypothetical protein
MKKVRLSVQTLNRFRATDIVSDNERRIINGERTMKNSKDKMIHLTPDYAISGDKLSVCLYRRRVTDKGKVQWDAKGYFTNYHHLKNRLVGMELFPLTSIDEIIRVSDSLKESLSESIKSLSGVFCPKCGEHIKSKKQ